MRLYSAVTLVLGKKMEIHECLPGEELVSYITYVQMVKCYTADKKGIRGCIG